MARGQHNGHGSAIPVRFVADAGDERDFFSLPFDTQVKLINKGITRWESESAASAHGKARSFLAKELGIKTGDVTTKQIAEYFKDEGAPYSDQFEQWELELQTKFRDKALAGELETVGPTVSQQEKDRITAATRAIDEILEQVNAPRRAKGVKLATLLLPHVRNEKNATDEQKEEVARQNAEIDERNNAKIRDFIAQAQAGGKYASVYQKHLDAVKAEREAARNKAKGEAAGVEAVSDLESLEEMDQAAQ